MSRDPDPFDVVIVGGGPAGLSAALVLGRCRRRTLVVDDGKPRNAVAVAMHGFLSRDGMSPSEFRQVSRCELQPYPNVVLWDGHVASLERDAKGFIARLQDGRTAHARKVLLATGLFDDLPAVEGFDDLYGKSIHNCPYCDGWEVRDMPVAVYGHGKSAYEMARGLTAWTSDLVLVSDGPSGLGANALRKLAAHNIMVREDKVARFDGQNGRLTHVLFTSGERLMRRAIFFTGSSFQHSQLAAKLGCSFNERGGVKCARYQSTDQTGVYVAGNAAKDVHLVIVAAAEGAKAAFGINRSLTREDFDERAQQSELYSPRGG